MNLKILLPISSDTNVVSSIPNTKNTAYVLPFSHPSNEPEPLSKHNQQNQSHRTTKIIIFILTPPSPMTQKTEFLVDRRFYNNNVKIFLYAAKPHFFQKNTSSNGVSAVIFSEWRMQNITSCNLSDQEGGQERAEK